MSIDTAPAPDDIEGTATDDQARPLPAVIPVVPTLAVTPQVSAGELVERLDVIREAMQTAMTVGVDYGVIPGTDKPTLLKPGAEKLSVLFQLDVQLRNEKQWGPGDHLTVVSHATVFHAPTGHRLGYGEGVCTTRERKYAYRRADRVCPACNAAAIIKGREEYGGGWVCFKKKGGCGAKYRDDDTAITGQQTGDIENPDLPDLWNTAVKMGEKRARVDAVLAVTGASALFTQDAEDLAPTAGEDQPHAPHAEPASPADPISAERAEAITQRVGDLFAAAALTPQQLSLAYTAAGGTAQQVNAEALRALTPEQADEFEAALPKPNNEEVRP